MKSIVAAAALAVGLAAVAQDEVGESGGRSILMTTGGMTLLLTIGDPARRCVSLRAVGTLGLHSGAGKLCSLLC